MREQPAALRNLGRFRRLVYRLQGVITGAPDRDRGRVYVCCYRDSYQLGRYNSTRSPGSYGKFRVSDDLPYLGPAGRPKRAAQDR